MRSASLGKPLLCTAAATLLLLLVPWVAMRFTSEIVWGPGDFVAAAALLFTAGMGYTLWSRRARTSLQRVFVGLAVFLMLAVVWAELAVGLFSPPLAGQGRAVVDSGRGSTR